MNGPRERIDRTREVALILGKAAARVERKGWTTGPLARTRGGGGHAGKACPSHDLKARKWSARGAIYKEIAGRRLKPSTEDIVLRMCVEAVAREIVRQGEWPLVDDDPTADATEIIDDWNDRPGRTRAVVAETLADSVRNIRGPMV